MIDTEGAKIQAGVTHERYDYSVHLDDGVELSSTTRFKAATASFFHRYEEWQTLRFVK